MKTISTIMLILSVLIFSCRDNRSNKENVVNLNIDLSRQEGPMKPVWAWFGYDEPNYTYMKDGKKLLTELAALSLVPVHIRTHNLLTTGNGMPALKWVSTNIYTEDAHGNPVYNWKIMDSIFDTWMDRGIKPLVEIGFMPKALSSKPMPYEHKWRPGAPYSEIYTGWAYPPKDYHKWAELVYQWVRHSTDRYGQKEVASWYWEVWNEPNIGYWQGTTEEYLKLYDFTADAVKRALPEARIGGPHTTGPSWDVAEIFLRTFLDHVINGVNYATGEKGAPLDYIGFHAKGKPELKDSVIVMNMGTQLRDISRGFEIVASYPELKNLPVIIGESDPEGCAACSMQDYPENAYRNGTMYSSYTAASFARIYQMADNAGINLKGVVTWAFEFENQPWFNGYRDLATNGVDKPVLNIFRMFGMMQGSRVPVTGDIAYNYKTIRDSSVRGAERDINALAVANDSIAMVMVWNYHDVDTITTPATALLNFINLPAENAELYHYRVDQNHSNSYTVWKEMGAPQKPDSSQIKDLEEAGKLQLAENPYKIQIKNGSVSLPVLLPGQAVSLIVLKFEKE